MLKLINIDKRDEAIKVQNKIKWIELKLKIIKYIKLINIDK